MTEPGAECPECGRRFIGHACLCGWEATPGRKDKEHLHPCDDCGTPTRLAQLTTAAWNPAHDDSLPKKHRCASCHVAYLKRRAELDPISPEDLATCKAQLERYFKQAEMKWRSFR